MIGSFYHKVDSAQHREGWYGSVVLVLGVNKGSQSLRDIPDHLDSSLSQLQFELRSLMA